MEMIGEIRIMENALVAVDHLTLPITTRTGPIYRKHLKSIVRTGCIKRRCQNVMENPWRLVLFAVRRPSGD